MDKLYPRVARLNLHLEDEQHILFSSDPEETRQVLKDSEMTQLTAFFMVCQEEKQMHTDPITKIPWSIPMTPYKDGGPPARDLLYRDIVEMGPKK